MYVIDLKSFAVSTDRPLPSPIVGAKVSNIALWASLGVKVRLPGEGGNSTVRPKPREALPGVVSIAAGSDLFDPGGARRGPTGRTGGR